MSSEPSTTKPKRQKADEKLADIEKQLKEAKNSAENYLTQLKYTRADLENLQKQTQRRIEDTNDRSQARILGEFLSIVDELGIVVANSTANKEGISMIYNKLLKVLETEGVRPIESVGKPFDPYRHEAVLEVETTEYNAGTIVEEIRRGYTFKDKVLRASMVKVAKAPSCKKEV